jgi:hypothetical protein
MPDKARLIFLLRVIVAVVAAEQVTPTNASKKDIVHAIALATKGISTATNVNINTGIPAMGVSSTISAVASEAIFFPHNIWWQGLRKSHRH